MTISAKERIVKKEVYVDSWGNCFDTYEEAFDSECQHLVNDIMEEEEEVISNLVSYYCIYKINNREELDNFLKGCQDYGYEGFEMTEEQKNSIKEYPCKVYKEYQDGKMLTEEELLGKIEEFKNTILNLEV